MSHYGYDDYTLGYNSGYTEGALNERAFQRRTRDRVVDDLKAKHRYAITSKDDTIAVKDEALNILGGILADRTRDLEDATAANLALQQSLDEATARIAEISAGSNPSVFFKVGDRVKAKKNMKVPYYVIRQINSDGTIDVKAPSGTLYRSRPAGGFIPIKSTFRPGDRVRAKGSPNSLYIVGEVNDDGTIRTLASDRFRDLGYRAFSWIGSYRWELA